VISGQNPIRKGSGSPSRSGKLYSWFGEQQDLVSVRNHYQSQIDQTSQSNMGGRKSVGPKFIHTGSPEKSPGYKYPSPLEFQKLSPTRRKTGVKFQKLQGYNSTGLDTPNQFYSCKSMTVLKPTPKSLFQISPKKFTTESTDDQIYSLLEANPLTDIPMTTSVNIGNPKISGRVTFTPQLYVSKSPNVSELKKSTTMTDGFG
jgi:hypothetical protein